MCCAPPRSRSACRRFCATPARAGSPPNTACCRARPATRTDREAARGRQSGRTQEIQRLIGRSLRAVTDLAALGERQIRIDCDVIAGRWRHPHRRDHRQLCRARIRPSALFVAAGAADRAAAARQRRRDLLRRRRRRAGARPRLCRGFAGRDRRQFRADRRRAASSRSRRPPKARRSTRRSSPRCCALARAGIARADRGASARRSGSADAWPGHFGGRPAGHRQPQSRARSRRSRRCWRPLRVERVSAARARPARAGGDRRHLRRQRGAEGAGRGRGERAAGARRRFRPRRAGAGRRARASTRRAGPARPRISAWRWSGSSASSATSDRARPFRRGAGARLARRPHAESVPTARSKAAWSGRRAATAASATTRCSCRHGVRSTFGEMDPAEKHRDQPPRPRLRQARRRACFRR